MLSIEFPLRVPKVQAPGTPQARSRFRRCQVDLPPAPGGKVVSNMAGKSRGQVAALPMIFCCFIMFHPYTTSSLPWMDTFVVPRTLADIKGVTGPGAITLVTSGWVPNKNSCSMHQKISTNKTLSCNFGQQQQQQQQRKQKLYNPWVPQPNLALWPTTPKWPNVFVQRPRQKKHGKLRCMSLVVKKEKHLWWWMIISSWLLLFWVNYH